MRKMVFGFWTCGFVATPFDGSMLYKNYGFKQNSNFNSLLWEVNMKMVLRRPENLAVSLLILFQTSGRYFEAWIFIEPHTAPAQWWEWLPPFGRDQSTCWGRALTAQGETQAATPIWHMMVRGFIFSSGVLWARCQGHDWMSRGDSFLSWCRWGESKTLVPLCLLYSPKKPPYDPPRPRQWWPSAAHLPLNSSPWSACGA